MGLLLLVALVVGGVVAWLGFRQADPHAEEVQIAVTDALTGLDQQQVMSASIEETGSGTALEALLSDAGGNLSSIEQTGEQGVVLSVDASNWWAPWAGRCITVVVKDGSEPTSEVRDSGC
ncbi:MAG: hypothetical protein DCC48_10235 [Acidobacteria bacterium]|nr:MAG: hypothetical protein DCC48_10235 [Acidobacteriota bacterium]